MHHYESECHAKILICYFQGQGHCKSSYDQIMTISAVSFELLILFYQTLLVVHYYMPECPVKKKKDYCIHGHGHSEGSKCNVCPDNIF